MSEHFRQLVREAFHKALEKRGLVGSSMSMARGRGGRLLVDDIPMRAGASMLRYDSDDGIGGSLLAGRRTKSNGGSLLAGVKPEETKAKPKKTKAKSKGDGGEALARFRSKVDMVRKRYPNMSFREAQQYVKSHN